MLSAFKPTSKARRSRTAGTWQGLAVRQPVSHLGTPLPLAHFAPPQAGWVRKVRSNLNRLAALGLKLTL